MDNVNIKDPLNDVVLTIILHTDGTFDIKGPIHDRALCYGMLEIARDAIYEHVKKLERQSNGTGGTSLMRRLLRKNEASR